MKTKKLRCTSIRKEFPKQLIVGFIYYLKIGSEYSLDDSEEVYGEIYNDPECESFVGNLNLNHFEEAKFNSKDINDAVSFREAVIGITNYMAFYCKENMAFDKPIEVDWGLKGTSKYEGKKDILPVITLIDRTEY